MRLSEYVLQVINDPKYGNDIEWVKGNLHRAHIEEIEASHVAEKRAEWEAEQGEPEWEYGNEMLMNNHTQIYPASSEFMAKAQAWLWPMYRRRKAGPWLPVPDTTNHESEG